MQHGRETAELSLSCLFLVVPVGTATMYRFRLWSYVRSLMFRSRTRCSSSRLPSRKRESTKEAFTSDAEGSRISRLDDFLGLLVMGATRTPRAMVWVNGPHGAKNSGPARLFLRERLRQDCFPFGLGRRPRVRIERGMAGRHSLIPPPLRGDPLWQRG